MLRRQGKTWVVWFWRRCRGHELQTWSVYRQRETDGKMGGSTDDTSEQGEHVIEHVAASLGSRQKAGGAG